MGHLDKSSGGETKRNRFSDTRHVISSEKGAVGLGQAGNPRHYNRRKLKYNPLTFGTYKNFR